MYFVTCKVNCWDDKIEESETGAACSRYGRYKKYIKFLKKIEKKKVLR